MTSTTAHRVGVMPSDNTYGEPLSFNTVAYMVDRADPDELGWQHIVFIATM